MIEIKEYEFEKRYQEDFIKLMKNIYKRHRLSEYHIEHIKKLIDKNNPSFNFIKIKSFIAYEDDEVIGHISAMIDERLKQDDQNVGLIGFYECIENDSCSDLLIKKTIDHLKNKDCQFVRAPIDLTIWHPYRFVVDQKEESFLLEPITKDYYISQFERNGFSTKVEYGSAQRTDLDTILPYTKEDFDKCIEEGFNIRNITKEDYDAGILSIYNMVNNIFSDSWSYVAISKEEYLYIYEDYKNNIENISIQIISDKDGKDVGFCSSIVDHSNKTIILKTIGVLPEYQNKKVGAALLHYQHKLAKKKGIIKEIYALIKLGNIVTKMPYPGVKIIRKYVAMEKEIIQ